MKFWNNIKELVKPETVYSDPKYIRETVEMGEVEKTSEQKGEEGTEIKKKKVIRFPLKKLRNKQTSITKKLFKIVCKKPTKIFVVALHMELL